MSNRMLRNIGQEMASLVQLREKYNEALKPGVSIIVPTFKEGYINNIFENYSRSNYPNKELVVILNKDTLDIKEYEKKAHGFENVRVFHMDESFALGECLNFGIENSKYDYISRMDDDDYYGPNYLTDLMNVFNYKDVQITGKNPVFVYFEDTSFLYILNHSNPVMGATFLFKKEIIEKVRFRDIDFMEDYFFLLDCMNSGFKIYPSDKYNYVYIRHSNLHDHTFRKPSDKFIQTYDVEILTATKNFPIFVTV